MTSPAIQSDGAPVPHGKRLVLAWLVLSAIATPLVVIFLGPSLPPGHASEQASGQVTDNTVMVGVATPICVFVLLFLGYTLWTSRNRTSEVLDGPPVRSDAGHQV